MLGFAWIYGDVIHNDADRLAEMRTFSAYPSATVRRYRSSPRS
jgi:hypothetical protein